MGYPLGAKYDSNAPYNLKRTTVQVCASITLHKTIDIEVEGDYDEVVLYELAQEKLEKDINTMNNSDWYTDEFVIVVDDEY